MLKPFNIWWNIVLSGSFGLLQLICFKILFNRPEKFYFLPDGFGCSKKPSSKWLYCDTLRCKIYFHENWIYLASVLQIQQLFQISIKICVNHKTCHCNITWPLQHLQKVRRYKIKPHRSVEKNLINMMKSGHTTFEVYVAFSQSLQKQWRPNEM